MRILLVSISFPPKSDAEGLQVAKYFRYLAQHNDLEIDVVTSPVPTLYMPFDPDLVPYSKGYDQLLEIPIKENRYINYFRNRLGLDKFIYPDTRNSFYKQYKKVEKLLHQKPDLIYSRSDPKSSALMAYHLKKSLNVPWIMHLSDPWSDCPLTPMSDYAKKKNVYWEKKCVELADIICLTSEPTIDLFVAKYPHFKSKFKLYPNVFEILPITDLTPEDHSLTTNKFRVVFTGAMVAERSPDYLLKPLSEIYAEFPEIGEKLEVILAGEADARSRSIMANYDLPFVNWIGKVSYKRALALQRTADYLVAIDNPISDPSKAVFFPSKLLDYMLARKRILAITSERSATSKVMRYLKGDVFQHHDSDRIKHAIKRAFDAFSIGDTDYLLSTEPPVEYEAKFNADRLYREIKNLVNA